MSIAFVSHMPILKVTNYQSSSNLAFKPPLYPERLGFWLFAAADATHCLMFTSGSSAHRHPLGWQDTTPRQCVMTKHRHPEGVGREEGKTGPFSSLYGEPTWYARHRLDASRDWRCLFPPSPACNTMTRGVSEWTSGTSPLSFPHPLILI